MSNNKSDPTRNNASPPPTSNGTVPSLSRRHVLRIGGVAIVTSGMGTGIATAQDNDDELRPLCEAVPTDVCLVIDVSGSMGAEDAGEDDDQTRLKVAQDGAKKLVGELDETDQGALVSFDGFEDDPEAIREFDLAVMNGDNKANLNDAIDGLSAFGGTNTQAGIIYGTEELTGDEALFTRLDTNPSSNARSDAEKVMVVLSDGESTRFVTEDGDVKDAQFDPDVDFEEAADAALDAGKKAKDEGIRILTVAIGEADVDFMEELASSPDDAFIDENMENLVEVFAEIAEAICPKEVDLDIKPCSDPNAITPDAKGVIPVGIKHTDEFDPTDPNSGVAVDTLRFGAPDVVINGDGATPAGDGHVEDVVPCEGDGMDDLVVHFPTQDTGFEDGDEEGWLVGETNDGELIAGRDSVKIVGGGGGP